MPGAGDCTWERRTATIWSSRTTCPTLAGYDTHPAWYLNLQAQPNCWVQLDRNKSKAAARDATAAEREQLWPRLTALFPPWGYFQKQTDRPFAIVIITPSAAA